MLFKNWTSFILLLHFRQCVGNKLLELFCLGVFGKPSRLVKFEVDAEDLLYFVGGAVVGANQDALALYLFVGVVA